MRQALDPGPGQCPGLVNDLFRQLVLLLGCVATAHLAIGRGGETALGLRLIEENEALRHLTDLAEASAPTLAASLAIAAILVAAFGLPITLILGHQTALPLGAITSIAAAWALSARFHGPQGPPPWLGAAAFAAALVVLVPRAPPLAVSVAGALLCTLWLEFARVGESVVLLEQIGEALLLGGMVIVAAAALRRRKAKARFPLIAFVVTAALVLIAGFEWKAATRHVIAHLLGLDKAGLPFLLMLVLVAASLGSLMFLAVKKGPERRLVLPLLVLLVAARDPSVSLAPLRSAAALTLWFVTLDRARQDSTKPPASKAA